MMLSKGGYYVAIARSEEAAITQARAGAPDLILATIGGKPERIVAFANRIREDPGNCGDIPIVFFA
jgi:CheY-like chemotaxis protein